MLILAAVIICFALGFFFFQGSSAPDGMLVPEAATVPVSADVLSLLNQIQSLRIDTSLFKNPAYQTLRDYTVPIPELNVGRTNPFAPLPGMPLNISVPTVRK